MRSALSRYFRARPGIKFFLIGLGLAGIGALVLALSKPAGATLMVGGLALIIGFKHDTDLRRGWPPWPLSEFSSSARARDGAIRAQKEAEVRRSPGIALAGLLMVIAGSIALLVWAALDWNGYRGDQSFSATFALIGAVAVIIVGPLRAVSLVRLLRAKRASAARAPSRGARRPVG